MKINRKLAATAIPLLVVTSMGAKGGCSNSSSNSNSTSKPTTKVTTVVPSPLPTPLALGDGIPIKGVPAPQTDANPIPRFPPNRCASVAFPADTGLRIEGKSLVGRVRVSCVGPLPEGFVHLTELQIWKVDGFEVLPIPGAYREVGQTPDIAPDYTTFKIPIPCTPGTYSFEYYVTWFDPQGTPGGAVGGGAQNAVVKPGDC